MRVKADNRRLKLACIIASIAMAVTPALSQPVCTGENGSSPLLETAFSVDLPYQPWGLYWLPGNRILAAGGLPGPLIVDIEKKIITPIRGLTEIDNQAVRLIDGTDIALSRDGRYAASYVLHLDEIIVFDLERSSLVSRRRHWPLAGSPEGLALKFDPGVTAFDKTANWLWVADLSTQNGRFRRFAMRVEFREPFTNQPVTVDLGDDVTNSDLLTASVVETRKGALMVSLLKIKTSLAAGGQSELRIVVVDDLTADVEGKATKVRTIKFKSNLFFEDGSVSNNIYVDWDRAFIFIVGPGVKGQNPDFITERIDFKTGEVVQVPFRQDYAGLTIKGRPTYTPLSNYLIKPFEKPKEKISGGIAVLRASDLIVLTLCNTGKLNTRVLSPDGKYLATGGSYNNRLDVFWFKQRIN